jgi:hypothetical protein
MSRTWTFLLPLDSRPSSVRYIHTPIWFPTLVIVRFSVIGLLPPRAAADGSTVPPRGGCRQGAIRFRHGRRAETLAARSEVGTMSVVTRLRRLLDRISVTHRRRVETNQELRDERGRSELGMAREGIKNPRMGAG